MQILNLSLKIDGFKYNSEKSSITKVVEDIPCGYSMSVIWTSDDIANKRDICKSEDCMKKVCESLREHAMKTFQRKKMIPLTNKK